MPKAKTTKATAKAEAATPAIKRGGNILAILKSEAETLGVAIRSKTGELSVSKLALAEALRDRIIAKDICTHAMEGNADQKAAAKKANQLQANQYIRWAYPDLKTVKSAETRTSQMLTFALPHVAANIPDYRGAFKTWCESTTSKARGGSDFLDSCVKLNRAVQKHEAVAKDLTPAFFAAAHKAKAKSAPDPKKAAEKARQNAKDAIMEAAKLLRSDRSVDAATKSALADLVLLLSGKTKAK